MSILKRLFGLEKKPQEYSMYIFSKELEEAVSLQVNLKKYCKKESIVLRSQEELFSVKPDKKDVLILIRPTRNKLGYGNNNPLILNTKKIFKHIIGLDIQFSLEELISAGCEYAISIEYGTLGNNTKGRVVWGVAGDFTMINMDQLNQAIENTQHRLLLHQERKGLLEEKANFYNGVKDIFLDRAQKTAHTIKEVEFILSQSKRFKSRRIFDGGCGSGRLSFSLADHGHIVTGMDISQDLLHNAPKHQNITYLRGDLLSTHQKDKSFDMAILMWHVLCDVKGQRRKLLREMNRILKHDGILIFDFPDKFHNKAITDTGVYSDETPFGKYVSLVPELKDVFNELLLLGFSTIEYKKVTWGIPKFVIIARKAGFSW